MGMSMSDHYETHELREMADGTVQKRCPGKELMGNWSCVGWFDLPKTGRPPTYCSTTCRVAAHRDRARRAEQEAARIAREQYLAERTAVHRERWVKFLDEHTPDNGRMTAAKCAELYEALLAAHMIDGPFPQRRFDI